MQHQCHTLQTFTRVCACYRSFPLEDPGPIAVRTSRWTSVHSTIKFDWATTPRWRRWCPTRKRFCCGWPRCFRCNVRQLTGAKCRFVWWKCDCYDRFWTSPWQILWLHHVTGDEAHAARALLRVLESAGPPMAARRKRRRKKSALRIVAPTKNVGGNDAWLVQSSAAASNTGIHGRKKTDEPELTLREQHVSLSEVTGKVYTCCATSVNTVADTSCHAHVTAHTTDAEPVLDTAKADGVNDKKCVGEHFPGQTFSTCGRRYYTPHHGDTLAKIAAVFGRCVTAFSSSAQL